MTVDLKKEIDLEFKLINILVEASRRYVVKTRQDSEVPVDTGLLRTGIQRNQVNPGSLTAVVESTAMNAGFDYPAFQDSGSGQNTGWWEKVNKLENWEACLQDAAQGVL